jgi:hypothetical protein
MLATCSNEEEKWTPEVAMSLVFFEVDISEHLPIDAFTLQFFTSMLSSNDLKKRSLKRAIAAVESLNKSVGDSLPTTLRGHWYNFPHDQSPTGQGAPIDATTFLNQLLPAFKAMKCFYAINYFAYEIVAEAIEQDSALKPVVDTILFPDYTGHIDLSKTIKMNIKDFSDNVDQIQKIKLQLFMSSELKANADIRLKLFDPNNAALDSFEVRMPISGRNESEEQPHIHELDEARAIIRSLNEISISISSDSLGITREMLKDLHNRKVNASVGLTVKMAINDNDAGR